MKLSDLYDDTEELLKETEELLKGKQYKSIFDLIDSFPLMESLESKNLNEKIDKIEENIIL